VDVKKNIREGEIACEQEFYQAARKFTLLDAENRQIKSTETGNEDSYT
jgi:hypothetical protein